MDANSQQKVMAKGFIILRSDDRPNIRIKFKGPGTSEWSTFEKPFDSKAARDRRMKELLKKPNYIFD